MSRQFTPSRFTLDISRPGHTPKKFACPQCNKKRFVRFIDAQTGAYLDSQYGRCDREEHCGYFLSPYKTEDKAPTTYTVHGPLHFAPRPLPELKIVPKDLVKTTLNFYDQNNLITFFTSAIGPQHTAAIIARYFIGTAKHGATIFWQIDKAMRCRTGARILYNPSTGKRYKDIPPARLFTKGNGFQPCLFGEHLLYTVSDKIPVVLVESEKTAALCSVYLPTINTRPVLWLATSGVNGLDDEKMKALAGKEIILCPDFSYHARATWGLVPMRKSTNLTGKPLPDPLGELDEDFVSLAERLQENHCKVKFFNPAPDVTDASDIADLLLAGGPPAPLVNQPAFESLILPTVDPPAQNSPQQAADVANLADNLKKVLPYANGSFIGKSFRIENEPGGRLKSVSDSLDITDYINELINREPLRQLIEPGGNGRIMSFAEVDAIYTAAELERANQVERYAQRKYHFT